MINTKCLYRLPIETLADNDAVELTVMQTHMKPWVPELIVAWWVIWVAVLVIVMYRSIIKPLLDAKVVS